MSPDDPDALAAVATPAERLVYNVLQLNRRRPGVVPAETLAAVAAWRRPATIAWLDASGASTARWHEGRRRLGEGELGVVPTALADVLVPPVASEPELEPVASAPVAEPAPPAVAPVGKRRRQLQVRRRLELGWSGSPG